MLFSFLITLSSGTLVRPVVIWAPAKYAGLSKLNPLFWISFMFQLKLLRPPFIFCILEPKGGENPNKSNTASSYFDRSFACCLPNSIKALFTATTAAPPIPKPLSCESIIPLAILEIFSLFLAFCSSSSSSSPNPNAKTACCNALNIKFCTAP